MSDYVKCGKCECIHAVISQAEAEASAAGLAGHLHCQRCDAPAVCFVDVCAEELPAPLTGVRGIVLRLTTPFLRTHALVQTRDFLYRLASLGDDAVPLMLSHEAAALLRHYPTSAEIERVHKALPAEFGPVIPCSRLSGAADSPGVSDANTRS